MAQRYEGERLREAERARGQMEEVLREMEMRTREMEGISEAERRARQRVEEMLEEVRAKEEELTEVKNEGAARM